MTAKEAIQSLVNGTGILIAMREELSYVQTLWPRIDAAGKAEIKAKINADVTSAKALIDEFNTFVQAL